MSAPDGTSDEHETVNRESHPNAGGPQGLTGDMGLSSERADGFEGVEGTGSSASARGHTDGETPTARAGEDDRDDEDATDPSRNPGH